jgi:hypothetical protein
MVKEVVENTQFYFALQTVLRRCPLDFGRVLGFGILLERRTESLNTCMQCVCYCNDLLNGLRLLPDIRKVLDLAKNNAFLKMKKTLENADYAKIQQKIEDVLAPTQTKELKQKASRRDIIVGAIKLGKSDAIDLCRKVREGLMKEFDEEIKNCEEKFKMTLTKKFTVGKGNG